MAFSHSSRFPAMLTLPLPRTATAFRFLAPRVAPPPAECDTELMTTDIGTIHAALAHIPAGDRDTWVRMAMAIKAEIGEEGFDTWDAWSQADETYSAADAKASSSIVLTEPAREALCLRFQARAAKRLAAVCR